MDKAMEAASNIAKEYNFDINVKDRVEEIPVGIKQKVGNPQGALQGAEILILDEPTAVLTTQETDELFVQLMKLRRKATRSSLFPTSWMRSKNLRPRHHYEKRPQHGNL